MPFVEHPIFTDPTNDYKIWRYMSFWKFESILEKRALFFCRADKFVDPFEGSLTRREAENLRDVWDIDGAISNFQKKLTALTLINCWHYNVVESDAMWQLYLKDNRGVAIQSNFQRLKNSFRDTTQEINIGKVRYLDYSNDIFYDRSEFNFTSYITPAPFIHKRSHYGHEQEYRAMTEVEHDSKLSIFEHDWSSEENENGKFIRSDIEELVEKVIVPPKADSNIVEEVEEIIQSNGFEFEVSKSSIDIEPWF